MYLSGKAPLSRFQPTHPHGVRLRGSERQDKKYTFQPTHPHGVRLCLVSDNRPTIISFNPRTRTGCD